MTTLIGDIHGDIPSLLDLVDGLKNWIQIGDLGVGMEHTHEIPHFKDGGRFIRGNHDDPELCKAHPSYLGDYGTTDEGYFFVSGAATPGFCIEYFKQKAIESGGHLYWWEDEQLGYEEMKAACQAYLEAKPDIMITHDAPSFLTQALISAAKAVDPLFGAGHPESNNTTAAFTHMFKEHKPKFWYFGHWHFPFCIKVQGCWFRCVGSEELVTVGMLD